MRGIGAAQRAERLGAVLGLKATNSLLTKRRLSLLIGTLAALGVMSCAARPEKPINWHDNESYSGWVIDAATGAPIEGAVIVAKWQIVQRHLLHSRTDQIIRLEEKLTDKEGRFQFAPLGNYEPPTGWERTDGVFPVLLFFKPGYEPKGLGLAEWKYGENADLPSDERPPPPRKIGWQREVQLYRYLTSRVPEHQAMNPIHQRMTDDQKILDRLLSFASSLASNVSRSGDYGSIPSRRALEAQWRAIAMVDEELRRYRPNYQWANGEIIEALKRARVTGKRQ